MFQTQLKNLEKKILSFKEQIEEIKWINIQQKK
jgi:hypothetical protein